MRVIIEGNIGSGKTQLIHGLGRVFPQATTHVEDVDKWSELLQLFYANPAQWALPLSLRVLLSHHAIASQTDSNTESIQFVERCSLSCRHVFTQLQFNDGTMPQHHWDLFREYYDVLGWEPTEHDVIVYLETPVDKCLQRIAKRGRMGEDVDIHYLRQIEFQYGNMLKYCGACPVIRLDGSCCMESVLDEAVRALSKYTTGSPPGYVPPPPQ